MKKKERLNLRQAFHDWQSPLLMCLLLLFAAAGTATAQSTDRDNPTALTSNTIKGTGVGKKVEYFYSLSAGPGEVVITIDLRASAGATSDEIELFDADSNKIFYYYPNATTTNERTVKRFTLNGKQTVTMRVALDQSAGDYAIKLDGAVEFAQSDTSQSPVSPTPDSGASSPTQSEQNISQPESGSGSSGGKSSKVSTLGMGLNILQAVGNRFALPTTGVLHIVMKDGTTQDIDLNKVKSASVNK